MTDSPGARAAALALGGEHRLVRALAIGRGDVRRERHPRDARQLLADALSSAEARKVLCWPKRCKLAHAFLWEHSYNRLKLAQLLGQLFFFLT
jgi:hypothetical protein